MILYPTTILFRAVRAIERALRDLREGRPTPANEGVDLAEYEQITEPPNRAKIENTFQGATDSEK